MEARLLLVGAVLAAASAVNSTAQQPPHIIMFLADDAGWNDFGFTAGLYPDQNGGVDPAAFPHALTPAIDQLAASGVIMMVSRGV